MPLDRVVLSQSNATVKQPLVEPPLRDAVADGAVFLLLALGALDVPNGVLPPRVLRELLRVVEAEREGEREHGAP